AQTAAPPTGALSAARRRARRRDLLMRYAFIAPAALYMHAFYGYPIVKNLVMSFQAYAFTTFFNGEAPFVGLANYRATLADPIFVQALCNTALFTVGSILGQFVLGMELALCFRRKIPLSGFLCSLLLLPWLLPMFRSVRCRLLI